MTTNGLDASNQYCAPPAARLQFAITASQASSRSGSSIGLTARKSRAILRWRNRPAGDSSHGGCGEQT
jgi:hypothetical protein